MNFLFPVGTSPKDQTQSRLLLLATVFLVLYAVILSLSPAVRLHTWQVTFRWQHWIGFAVWIAGFAYIHRLTIKHLPDRDAYILPLIGILAGLGLLTVWRLDTSFGLRQTIWTALGLLIFAVLTAVCAPKFMRPLTPPCMKELAAPVAIFRPRSA